MKKTYTILLEMLIMISVVLLTSCPAVEEETSSSNDNNNNAGDEEQPKARALTYSAVLKNGEDGVDELGGAWGVTVSPDNNNLYVKASDNSTVATFRRD